MSGFWTSWKWFSKFKFFPFQFFYAELFLFFLWIFSWVTSLNCKQTSCRNLFLDSCTNFRQTVSLNYRKKFLFANAFNFLHLYFLCSFRFSLPLFSNFLLRFLLLKRNVNRYSVMPLNCKNSFFYFILNYSNLFIFCV